MYDSARDRLIAHRPGSLEEFDGTSWQPRPPLIPSSYASTVPVFDSTRSVTVLFISTTNGPEAWEWDGTSWAFAGPGPTSADPAVFHVTLGSIVSVGAVTGGFDVFEWNAGNETIHSSANRPPNRRLQSLNLYRYGPIAYDTRRDKLVMFGRYEHHPPPLNSLIQAEAVTWEWDPINGWVDMGNSGPMLGSTMVWFDAHRGRVMRHDHNAHGSVIEAYMYDGNGGWDQIGVQGTGYLATWNGAYDSRRNRRYGYTPGAGLSSWSYLADVHPATYQPHAAGCTGPNPLTLELSEPWTRAWLDGTMAVDIAGLPLGVGILAMGFDDQTFAGQPLPQSLQPIGMPQCTLNIAPAASVFGTPSGNGRATVQFAIPNSIGLLGVG